jgi:hypothetical protein
MGVFLQIFKKIIRLMERALNIVSIILMSFVSMQFLGKTIRWFFTFGLE